MLITGNGMGEKKSNADNEESELEINKKQVSREIMKVVESHEIKKLIEYKPAAPEEERMAEELIDSLSNYIENLNGKVEFNKILVSSEINKLLQVSTVRNYSYLVRGPDTDVSSDKV